MSGRGTLAFKCQLGKTRTDGIAAHVMEHLAELVRSPKLGLHHRFPRALRVASTIQIPVTSPWGSVCVRQIR